MVLVLIIALLVWLVVDLLLLEVWGVLLPWGRPRTLLLGLIHVDWWERRSALPLLVLLLLLLLLLLLALIRMRLVLVVLVLLVLLLVLLLLLLLLLLHHPGSKEGGLGIAGIIARR
jgi:hypothetical protein